MKTAIGATCEIEWKEEPGKTMYRYVSFAEWVDDATEDSFGIADEEIFFYCPGGEKELMGLMGDSPEDFKVLTYEVQWKS